MLPLTLAPWQVTSSSSDIVSVVKEPGEWKVGSKQSLNNKNRDEDHCDRLCGELPRTLWQWLT